MPTSEGAGDEAASAWRVDVDEAHAKTKASWSTIRAEKVIFVVRRRWYFGGERVVSRDWRPSLCLHHLDRPHTRARLVSATWF